jgi:hypothetical protein
MVRLRHLDAAALDKVSSLVADAVERGAKVLTGGEVAEGKGYFYLPTVLTGVPRDARMSDEEIFGPVAPLTGMVGLNQGVISNPAAPSAASSSSASAAKAAPSASTSSWKPSTSASPYSSAPRPLQPPGTKFVYLIGTS